MSTLKVNDIQEATSGGGKIWPARAYIVFNGTGTVAINDDGNFSSLTDNGTGYYTCGFSNNFSNTSYTMAGSTIGINFGIAEDGIVIRPVSQVSSPDPEMSTSSISVQTGGYGLADRKYNSFTVHKS